MQKKSNSVTARGWIVVCEDEYANLPDEVRCAFLDPKHQRPTNQKQKIALWKDVERLIFSYANRLSSHYGVEYDDTIQEAYIFFEQLLTDYEPLYKRLMRESDLNEDAKKFSRIYTYDENGVGWAWKLYRIKPYIFSKIYTRIKNYVQKTWRHHQKSADLENRNDSSGDPGDLSGVLFDNAIYRNSLGGQVSSYLQVERKMLNDELEDALDDLIVDYRSTKKDVAELFFKNGLSEKQIYKILGKSQSTINSHIATIKRHLQTHPKVVSMVQEFDELGISAIEVLE